MYRKPIPKGGVGLDSPHVDLISNLGVTNFIRTLSKKFNAEFSDSGKIEEVREIPPDNQIWYDAPSQVTLYSQTNVVSHTFADGRGIVTFSGDNTTILDWFRGTDITAVYWSSAVRTIAASAFRGCPNLISIPTLDGITSIQGSAFYKCMSLTGDIVIPSTIAILGDHVFELCVNIASVTIKSPFVTSGAIYLFAGDNNAALTMRYTKVIIEEGVTYVARSMLQFSAITELVLPSTITNIGRSSFYGCRQLESITCLAIVPPTLGLYVFDVIKSGAKIYVPSQSVEAYKTATNWSQYASKISAIPE